MGVGGLIFWMGVILIGLAVAILSGLALLLSRQAKYDRGRGRPEVHPTWLFEDTDGVVYGSSHHRQGQGS